MNTPELGKSWAEQGRSEVEEVFGDLIAQLNVIPLGGSKSEEISEPSSQKLSPKHP